MTKVASISKLKRVSKSIILLSTHAFPIQKSSILAICSLKPLFKEYSIGENFNHFLNEITVMLHFYRIDSTDIVPKSYIEFLYLLEDGL